VLIIRFLGRYISRFSSAHVMDTKMAVYSNQLQDFLNKELLNLDSSVKTTKQDRYCVHKVCFERLIDEHSTYRDLLSRIKVLEKKVKRYILVKNLLHLNLPLVLPVKNNVALNCNDVTSCLGFWCVLVAVFSITK